MTAIDDSAREAQWQIQSAVHDLRDLTHDLTYITTATRIAGDFPTLLGRLGNIAENIAEQLRRLAPHASGANADLLVEDAALAMDDIRAALRDLAENIHDRVARAYSVVGHKTDASAVTR